MYVHDKNKKKHLNSVGIFLALRPIYAEHHFHYDEGEQPCQNPEAQAHLGSIL
jgi:hypothetical protein